MGLFGKKEKRVRTEITIGEFADSYIKDLRTVTEKENHVIAVANDSNYGKVLEKLKSSGVAYNKDSEIYEGKELHGEEGNSLNLLKLVTKIFYDLDSQTTYPISIFKITEFMLHYEVEFLNENPYLSMKDIKAYLVDYKDDVVFNMEISKIDVEFKNGKFKFNVWKNGVDLKGISNYYNIVDVLGNLVTDKDLVNNYNKLKAPLFLGGLDEVSRPLFVDLYDNTATVIVGKAGSGKTMLLKNILAQLQMYNTEETLSIDVLDSSPEHISLNNKIVSIKDLKSLQEFDDYLEGILMEMSETKNLLIENRLENVGKLNSIGHNFKHKVIVFEDMTKNMVELKKEADYTDNFRLHIKMTEMLSKITEEGRSLGVHLICVSQRAVSSSIPKSVMLNSSLKIKLPTYSESEHLMMYGSHEEDAEFSETLGSFVYKDIFMQNLTECVIPYIQKVSNDFNLDEIYADFFNLVFPKKWENVPNEVLRRVFNSNYGEIKDKVLDSYIKNIVSDRREDTTAPSVIYACSVDTNFTRAVKKVKELQPTVEKINLNQFSKGDYVEYNSNEYRDVVFFIKDLIESVVSRNKTEFNYSLELLEMQSLKGVYKVRFKLPTHIKELNILKENLPALLQIYKSNYYSRCEIHQLTNSEVEMVLCKKDFEDISSYSEIDIFTLIYSLNTNKEALNKYNNSKIPLVLGINYKGEVLVEDFAEYSNISFLGISSISKSDLGLNLLLQLNLISTEETFNSHILTKKFSTFTGNLVNNNFLIKSITKEKRNIVNLNTIISELNTRKKVLTEMKFETIEELLISNKNETLRARFPRMIILLDDVERVIETINKYCPEDSSQYKQSLENLYRIIGESSKLNIHVISIFKSTSNIPDNIIRILKEKSTLKFGLKNENSLESSKFFSNYFLKEFEPKNNLTALILSDKYNLIAFPQNTNLNMPISNTDLEDTIQLGNLELNTEERYKYIDEFKVFEDVEQHLELKLIQEYKKDSNLYEKQLNEYLTENKNKEDLVEDIFSEKFVTDKIDMSLLTRKFSITSLNDSIKLLLTNLNDSITLPEGGKGVIEDLYETTTEYTIKVRFDSDFKFNKDFYIISLMKDMKKPLKIISKEIENHLLITILKPYVKLGEFTLGEYIEAKFELNHGFNSIPIILGTNILHQPKFIDIVHENSILITYNDSDKKDTLLISMLTQFEYSKKHNLDFSLISLREDIEGLNLLKKSKNHIKISENISQMIFELNNIIEDRELNGYTANRVIIFDDLNLIYKLIEITHSKKEVSTSLKVALSNVIEELLNKGKKLGIQLVLCTNIENPILKEELVSKFGCKHLIGSLNTTYKKYLKELFGKSENKLMGDLINNYDFSIYNSKDEKISPLINILPLGNTEEITNILLNNLSKH